MCDTCGCAVALPGTADLTLAAPVPLLTEHAHVAAHNRAHFDARGLRAVDCMGTPGAGKTALLEATIRAGRWRIAVLEGDQASARDSARIRAAGAAAVQIETGLGCHLDARQVHDALDALPLAGVELLFIENVGNLVCPALFALGAHLRVLVTSVAEGADKPLKYPPMFRAADLVVLNKIDLLPYVPFDLAEFRRFVAAVNPRVPVVALSALRGDGLADWFAALDGLVAGDPRHAGARR